MEPVFGRTCYTGMWIGLGGDADDDDDHDHDDDYEDYDDGYDDVDDSSGMVVVMEICIKISCDDARKKCYLTCGWLYIR